MKLLKLFFITTISLVIYCINESFALSLQEYLSQVRNDNIGYNSSKISYQSSDLLSKKSLLLTTPNFFATAQSGFEKQNQAIAFVRYRQINTQHYSAGVEQDFSFGLNSKFYYNINRNAYQGLNSPSIVPLYYQTNPVLSLTMPLWKDRFGSTIKANQDSTHYSNQSNKFITGFDAINFEIDSEKSYWQLVVNGKIVTISNEALRQAEKILQNANKKAIMNLGEKSDVLQAKADVESKKLQLRQAENDARIAARNFNQKRYINSDFVKEKLDDIDLNYLEKLSISKNMPNSRYDIKASYAASKVAIAKAKIEEENNKPQFDLYGSYGFGGLETSGSQALANSFAQAGDVAFIGIKFSMPIAVGLGIDIQKGAMASAAAAKMNYRQKVFNQENDWQNLLQNLEDNQESLRLSRKIEYLQKSKVENERTLLSRGRTSTYQVLLFEQDYNQARINTIKNASKLLGLIADKKSYQ